MPNMKIENATYINDQCISIESSPKLNKYQSNILNTTPASY